MGTRNLNQVLQQLLNPPHPDKSEVTAMGKTIRVGGLAKRVPSAAYNTTEK